MKKKFTLLLLFICVFQTFASGALTPEEKLFTTGKLWGFLKYYHPNVANGKQDWDNELSNIIDKTKTADSKEALSKIYSDWIDGFGTMKVCKSCAKPSKVDHFDKNFDLSWTQNQNLFTSELAAKLKFIEANRFQGKSHYFSINSGIENVEIRNESVNKNSDWSNKNLRLLSLFRYWNQIEYFFPYKYMTDQKWDNVLAEMIPKFTKASTEQEFHLAMLELVIKVDDTHANLNTPIIRSYFGTKWIPAAYDVVEGKILITALYDLIFSEENGLKINDVIEKIDGQNVNDIIKQRGRYLNGSNLVTKLRQSDLLLFSGQNDSVRLTINRNGNSIEKVVKRYTSENMQYAAKPKLTWEIKPNNIGYINMGLLTIKETRDVMNQLKQTKSIIFDLRNYPKGTFMVLPTYLFSEPRSFAKLIAPDPDYPGKFYWKKEFPKGSKNNDAYNGKLIVLVNEQTQSQAEWTAMVIQSVPGTVTIGSQTAGADGDVSTLEFPNGSKTYMTGLGVFYPDGTETQRKGIKIDIEVKPTILGIQQGKDEVLEKALEIAKQ